MLLLNFLQYTISQKCIVVHKKRLQNNTTKIGYDKLYDLFDGYYICVLIVSSEFGNGCQNFYTDKENKVLAACIIVISNTKY